MNDLHGISLEKVEAHYVPRDLKQAVLQVLAALGKDKEHLGPEDTAPIDEFHIRGREATLELAGQLGLGSSHRVLDVGCGIGGPSRHLAHAFGCHVTGLDLAESYCEVARLIAERLGMTSRLTYLQGDALAMPFPDGAFDVVWTQHAAMNIPDKAAFYKEIRRVLKPGGLFAMYDVLAGTAGEPYYPLPWARDPAMSFLISAEALRSLLDKAGLHVASWRDTSEEGRNWFRKVAARKGLPGGETPPGLQVLLGPDIRVMSRNVVRNLDECRIALMEVVAR